jgi:TolA-binding protein
VKLGIHSHIQVFNLSRTSQRTNLTKNPKTPQAPRALEKRTLVHTSTKHSLTHFSTPRSSTTAQTSTDRIPTNSLRSQDRNDEVISVLEKRIRALEEEIDTLKREYTAQILHIRTELMALKLRK